MALWELIFVLGMSGLQLVYLVNRRRRWPQLNYLLYLLGGVAALSLIFEGWRWQTLPVFILWLWQGFYLMITLRTLHEGFRLPRGFLGFIGSIFRSVLVTGALILCLISLAMGYLFPIPDMKPTGPLAVSVLELTSKDSQDRLLVFYPAGSPAPAFSGGEISKKLRLLKEESYSGPKGFFDYQDRADRALTYSSSMMEGKGPWPVIYFFPGNLESSWDWAGNLSELASRGYVVAAWLQDPLVWMTGKAPRTTGFPWDFIVQEQVFKTGDFPAVPLGAQVLGAQKLLSRLARESGWQGRLDLKKTGIIAAGEAVKSLGELNQSKLNFAAWAAWGSQPLKRSWNPQVLGLEVPVAMEDRSSLEAPVGMYTLIMPKIMKQDLTDQAYLSPYLYPLGWRSRIDPRSAYLTSRVTGAFFDWQMGRGDGSLFLYGKPDLQDVMLNRPR